jgi:hypothetical protein
LDILDVLARRTDLSTFLVHLTRDAGGMGPKERLERMLATRVLLAGAPMGHAVAKLRAKKLDADLATQQVVCFSEAPLEHVKHLLGEIDKRQCSFAPYGIAIPKKQGRARGVNPVWYLDMTPGQTFVLTNAVEGLVADALARGSYVGTHIGKLTPFIEQMGTWPSTKTRKEFWWEREWRHVGDFRLPPRIIILCPEEERAHFSAFIRRIDEKNREDLKLKAAAERWPDEQLRMTEMVLQPHFESFRTISPSWSLEEMLGVLAGWDVGDLRL